MKFFYSKKKECKTIDSKIKFRSLFGKVPVGVFQTTSDGIILTVNPLLVNMLSYDYLQDFNNLTGAQDLFANPQDKDIVLFELGKKVSYKILNLL